MACTKLLLVTNHSVILLVLQPYTKILEKPTKRRSTKPTRLNLTEPMYMDMANSLANSIYSFY